MRLTNRPAISVALATIPLMLAAPAFAQDENADPTPTEQAEEQPEDQELICRTERVIGSLAKRRKTCLTRAEWERVATKGNAFARKLVSDSAGGIWDNAPDPGN